MMQRDRLNAHHMNHDLSFTSNFNSASVIALFRNFLEKCEPGTVPGTGT